MQSPDKKSMMLSVYRRFGFPSHNKASSYNYLKQGYSPTEEELLVASNLNKEARRIQAEQRALELFKLYKELGTLEAVAATTNLTRERIRQIFNVFMLDEYRAFLESKRELSALKKNELHELVCTKCGKTHLSKRLNKKYCSKTCWSRKITLNKYPDWVAGRSIHKQNFTTEEWREINRLRARSYYQRNRVEQKSKALQRRLDDPKMYALYQLRSMERKIYGYAKTPIPQPKNIHAMKL